MKKPKRLRRDCALGRLETLEPRALMTIVATAPLPDINVAAPGATAVPINLDAYFKDSAPVANSYAVVNTSLGSIPVELTPGTTPKTVANFLSYVDKGAYTNAIVHRSVPGFIWQTGGYQLTSSGSISAIPQSAPVVNEFSQSNVRGTIAMAKLGSDPNSATNQFFFNESDSNASNLDNQNGGFTVFGHVVGSQGLAVMDAVGAVPVPSPGPLASPLDEIPLQNYTTGASVQPTNLVLINNVTTTSQVFQATSDTPGVATATIQNDNLAVQPLASGTAHITVTGYGSDGQPVSATFAVNVGGTTPPAATTTPTTTPTTTATTTTGTGTGTTTTAATPVTTTTTTAAAPPVPSSILVPGARGALPTSIASGRGSKLQQTVTLSSPSTNVDQKEQVAITLVPAAAGQNPVTIASAAPKVKLRMGQHTKVNLSARNISAPAGTYEVTVSVTDPDGATTTVDTGRSLTVRAREMLVTSRMQ